MISLLFLSWSVSQAEPLAPEIEGFFERHCYECHDDLTTEGDLDLYEISTDLTAPKTLWKWTHLYDRVANGEMPPKKKPRPDAAASDRFLAALSEEIIAAESKIALQEGSGRVRRLNRVEYENTLRDLLSLPLLQVKDFLPEDGVKHGFAKVPSALEVSHVQIKQYMAAADHALRQAIMERTARPTTEHWREAAVLQGSARSAISTHNAAPLSDGKLLPQVSFKIREIRCLTKETAIGRRFTIR